MPLPPNSLPLKHYVLTRWACSVHGYFETGTIVHHQIYFCPECGDPAQFVEYCDGMTSRSLPFVSRPRLDLELDAGGWQVTGHTGVTTRPKSARASIRRNVRREGKIGRPRRDAGTVVTPLPVRFVPDPDEEPF